MQKVYSALNLWTRAGIYIHFYTLRSLKQHENGLKISNTHLCTIYISKENIMKTKFIEYKGNISAVKGTKLLFYFLTNLIYPECIR